MDVDALAQQDEYLAAASEPTFDVDAWAERLDQQDALMLRELESLKVPLASRRRRCLECMTLNDSASTHCRACCRGLMGRR